MSDEQGRQEGGQPPAPDSAPAEVAGGSPAEAVTPETSGSQPGGGTQHEPSNQPPTEPQWRLSDDAMPPGVVEPAADPLDSQTVPLRHLFEARNQAREHADRVAQYEERVRNMEAELKQWNELSPRLQERLGQADQFEQQVAVYERQLAEAMKTLETEGVEWKPPDVQTDMERDRALQTVVQAVTELRSQLPSLIDQGIQTRERSYQEAQRANVMRQRQEGFEKELEGKLAQAHHLPLQSREMYRRMILSDASQREFSAPVDEYLKTIMVSAPPPPPPPPRGNAPSPPPGGREPAQTTLGDWEGKTWDDFGGDPWDVKT